MTKHAPGPLSFSAQTGPAGHCFIAQVWGPDGCSVAEIVPTEDRVEATAYARLFAAAPELLEACRRADAGISDWKLGEAISPVAADYVAAVQNALRAAIEKAEGR